MQNSEFRHTASTHERGGSLVAFTPWSQAVFGLRSAFRMTC